MRRKRLSTKRRLELAECAFAAHGELKEYAAEALRLALLAESMGQRRTAGQLRAAAALMGNTQKLYVQMLKEGFLDRNRGRRR